MIAGGRIPNTHDLGLDQTGVKADERGFITVDDELRTSVTGAWALGDVNGRAALTHTAYNEYENRASTLFHGKHRKVTDESWATRSISFRLSAGQG